MSTVNFDQLAQDLNTEMSTAVVAYRTAGRAVVDVFERYGDLFLQEWKAERMEFMLASLNEFPVLQDAAVKILKGELTLDIKRDGKKGSFTYTVKKPEAANKKWKAKCQENWDAFKAKQLTSLLNHDKIKVTVEFDFGKTQVSLKRLVQKAVDADVSKQDLIDAFTKMVNEAEKAGEKLDLGTEFKRIQEHVESTDQEKTTAQTILNSVALSGVKAEDAAKQLRNIYTAIVARFNEKNPETNQENSDSNDDSSSDDQSSNESA